MVRLKDGSRLNEMSVEEGFNSLMVRLKVTDEEKEHKAYIEFQFLDGAIKSLIRGHPY